MAKAQGPSATLDTLRLIKAGTRTITLPDSSKFTVRGLSVGEVRRMSKVMEAEGGDTQLAMAWAVALGAVEPQLGEEHVDLVLSLPVTIVSELALAVSELTGATEEEMSRAAEAFR